MPLEDGEFDIPPQAMEVEKHVIGAMLLDAGAIAEVRSVLKPENFYLTQHEILARAIFELDDNGITPDLITVSERLKAMKRYDDAGGDNYLMEISSEVVSSANVAQHSEIIMDLSIRRNALAFGARFYEAAKDRSVNTADLLSKYDSGIALLAQRGAKDKPVRLFDTMKGVMVDVELRASGGLNGMVTGFRDLDEKIETLGGGQIYVIGGIPGSGKTLLGSNIGMNLAMKQKAPGLVISLEMNQKALGTRLLAAQAGVALRHLKRGTLPRHEYHNLSRALLEMKDVPLWIDVSSRCTPSMVRSKARLMQRENKIKWLMLDYVQLMTSDRKFHSRYEELTQVSVDLLAASRDLDIPFIIMAQLDKESSKGGTPTMGNVKETGQLIQDAHAVILMHRPTMFDKKLEEEKIDDDPFSKNPLGTDYSIKNKFPPDLAYAIIEKNRDGELGAVKLKANLPYQRFENWG